MFGSLAFQLVAFVLFFAFSTYACIFGDPETSPVGRFCTVTIPNRLLLMLERCLGHERLSRLSKLGQHAFQLVYLIVVLGSWSIVFAYGYPMIRESAHISSHHRYAGAAAFLACMGSWHRACRTRPGYVTSKTMMLYDHYPYDGVLYVNKVCPTLKIRKIARSKFDRQSGRHVPRFDHHCGWLNMAVGERNYREFLVFLGVQVFMCCYGTWAMWRVLMGEVIEKDLLNATFFNAVTGAEVQADRIIVFHYLFARHSPICGVLLLMSVMSVVLGMFLGFHLYISSKNMTTNEYFKWRAVKRWHRKEKMRYERTRKDGKIGRKMANDDAGPGGALLSEQVVPDGDVGCTGPVAASTSAKDDDAVEDDILDPGPMPKNIYNKGIISNLSEVFFPLSYREDAIRRYGAALSRDGHCSDDRGDNNGNCRNGGLSSEESVLKPKAV